MFNIKEFIRGLRIKSKTTLDADTKGELEVKDTLFGGNGASGAPIILVGVSGTVQVTSNVATVTKDSGDDFDAYLEIGSVVELSGLSGANSVLNGTHTLTAVAAATIEFSITTPDFGPSATDSTVILKSADGKLSYHDGISSSTVVTENHEATLTNKTIDVDNNTVSNLEVDNLKLGVLNTDSTFTGATDTQIPSALAVKNALDAQDDASEITYTPLDNTDWNGDVDPGNVNSALDQLAERENDHAAANSEVHGLGPFDGNVVGESAGQTLTNKIIDSEFNTLTVNADEATVENIVVGSFKTSAIVTEAEGIANNDNDTTLPTSAAVKDYVDSQILTKDEASEIGFDDTNPNVTGANVQLAVEDVADKVASNTTDISNLETLSGSAGAVDHGTFTGTTILDNSSTKEALQALETKVEAVEDIAFDGFGLFSGSFTNNATTPQNLLSIDVFLYSGYEFIYTASRGSGGSKIVEVGKILLSYNSGTSTYSVNNTFVGDDVGITFTASGSNLQYTSTNSALGSEIIKIKIIERI